MSREAERHAAQRAFLDSNAECEAGRQADLPLPLEVLTGPEAALPGVKERFGKGLSGVVYHLETPQGDYALKRRRVDSLVRNFDGETSFLNEVQRRAEFAALGDACPPGVARTTYASWQHGLIVGPWIPGGAVRQWDEAHLLSVFEVLEALVLLGQFEWDLSDGNLLDDGERVRVFDFGYMYRYDPLHDYNNNGLESPMFHVAERFETRCYSAVLLKLELTEGMDAALRAFVLEKQIALESYRRLLAQLRTRGADENVIGWMGGIIRRWETLLASDPAALYLFDGWRAHRLDLGDDLHGKSCTRRTLQRADWLIDAAQRHFAELGRLDALLWDDAECSREQLLARLQSDRDKAVAWQLMND